MIGPSGSGKSTYCSLVQKMAQTAKRNIVVVNLDPASEYLPYQCHIDIRELVTLADVMEEFKLGELRRPQRRTGLLHGVSA